MAHGCGVWVGFFLTIFFLMIYFTTSTPQAIAATAPGCRRPAVHTPRRRRRPRPSTVDRRAPSADRAARRTVARSLSRGHDTIASIWSSSHSRQQDRAVPETNTDAHTVGWGTHHTSTCIIYTTTHKHHAHFLSFGELVPRHDTAGLLGEVRRIRRWGWRCGRMASGSGHTRSTGWGNVSELKRF